MEKCKIYNDKFWQNYLLNRLDRKGLEEAQFHLHHCTCCREKLKRMRMLIQNMHIPSSRKEKSNFQLSTFYRHIAVVACVLTVSIGGYVWLRTSSDKESTIIITPPPVNNTLDSLKNATDSSAVEKKKDTISFKAD